MRLIVAHGHIFKNAGTTFDWSLERSFGHGFMDHRDDKLMREHGTRLLGELATSNPGLAAISSHHMAGQMPDIDGCRFVPIYLLRHPIERIRSVYDFERQQLSDSLGARTAKKKSFRDYVAWRMEPGTPRTIQNYQTLYLAGRHDYLSPIEPGTSIFDQALGRLRANALIGTVERYDESMVVIEHRLRKQLPSLDLAYVRQNVTRRRGLGKPKKTSSAILKSLGELSGTVIDKNSLDLALHQLANRWLDAAIAEIDEFDTRLANFKARCAELRESS